jgi:hypothetical protein
MGDHVQIEPQEIGRDEVTGFIFPRMGTNAGLLLAR